MASLRRLRVVAEPNPDYKPPAGISGPASQEQLVEAFRPYLDSSIQEHNVAVAMDAGCHVIGYTVTGIGHAMNVSNTVADLLRFALLSGAAQFALLHYHPHKGASYPSAADVEFFKHLKTASDMHGIRLADDIIVSLDGFFSFHRNGLFQPGAQILSPDGRLVTV